MFDFGKFLYNCVITLQYGCKINFNLLPHTGRIVDLLVF